jgi:hypothetical protein
MEKTIFQRVHAFKKAKQRMLKRLMKQFALREILLRRQVSLLLS